MTAYYPIKSKFPNEVYMQWIDTFMTLDAPIVLFTAPSLGVQLLRNRGTKPIQVYEIPFDELEAYRKYKILWQQHHALDRERAIHSPELYAIWAQKPYFVAKAIAHNPFCTDYFFWCDIGAFRNGSIHPTVCASFPTTIHLPADKILMSSVASLQPQDKITHHDGIIGDFFTVDRIVGGLWGGGKEGCRKWLHAYTTMLERYFQVNRFAGKDQSVMLSTYLHDPSFAEIVLCNVKNPEFNPWFYLQYLCSNLAIPKCLDPSYIL